MQEWIEEFKKHVRELSANTDFIHHEWFVTYHLEIVERIALELLDKYPEADRDVVLVMVWMHDYGKILDFDNQYATTLSAGLEVLVRFGFEPAFANRVVEYVEMIDKKMVVDLHEAPIEVRIVSSADGASHHVGPFMAIHWRENPTLSTPQLMERNIAKTMKDWDRKMVLPEVRAAFEWRHRAVLENSGQLPGRFLG